MKTVKTIVFFRIDHPNLKKIVDSFGDEVSGEDMRVVEKEAIELDSDTIEYGMGYDMCKEGSVRFNQLIDDKNKRYVQKTHYIPVKER